MMLSKRAASLARKLIDLDRLVPSVGHGRFFTVANPNIGERRIGHWSLVPDWLDAGEADFLELLSRGLLLLAEDAPGDTYVLDRARAEEALARFDDASMSTADEREWVAFVKVYRSCVTETTRRPTQIAVAYAMGFSTEQPVRDRLRRFGIKRWPDVHSRVAALEDAPKLTG